MTGSLFEDVRPDVPGARRAFDFYPTPFWMTRALIRRLPWLRDVSVLEPCSGNGAITRELELAGARVVTNDYDPARQAMTHLDAGDPFSWKLRSWRADWVITNPPFNEADRIVPLAFEHARRGVAMLLRASWLEPTKKRAAFLKAHPPRRLIILPRYSFLRNGSSDSVTSAWFVWDHRLHWGGVEVVTTEERDLLIAHEGEQATS